MKKVFVFFLLAILLCGCADKKTTHITIGNPAEQQYTEKNAVSRNPWDMVVYEGKLYVGAGDYDKNTGPAKISEYNISKHEWKLSASLPDEQISRFKVIDGILYAPGIDPKSEWAVGNLYYNDKKRWQTISNVPDSVHLFDIAKFGDKIFYGIGTSSHDIAPVKASSNQKDYSDIYFYKDGQKLTEQGVFGYLRVYDFFVLKEQLYCAMRNPVKNAQDAEKVGTGGIYKYDGEAFQYYAPYYSEVVQTKDIAYVPLPVSETVGDSVYLVTGHLYKTEDFVHYTEIKMPDESTVVDILKEGKTLYILSKLQLSDSTFKTTVWRLDEEPVPLYSFDFGLGAMSFAKNGTSFYVGIGEIDEEIYKSKSDIIGTIIEIKNIQ